MCIVDSRGIRTDNQAHRRGAARLLKTVDKPIRRSLVLGIILYSFGKSPTDPIAGCMEENNEDSHGASCIKDGWSGQ
jgi:hypothetical protein